MKPLINNNYWWHKVKKIACTCFGDWHCTSCNQPQKVWSEYPWSTCQPDFTCCNSAYCAVREILPTQIWQYRYILCYILQESSGEEVIANVSSTVHQLSSRSSELSCLWLDLTVLHHLADTLHPANHTHWLWRIGLFHHLWQDRGYLLDFYLISILPNENCSLRKDPAF